MRRKRKNFQDIRGDIVKFNKSNLKDYKQQVAGILSNWGINGFTIYQVDGVEYDDESLEEAYVFNKRKQDYVEISKTRVKRLRTQARAIVKKIDKVYSNNTTVLRKVGQFNNGEAIYESV